MPIGTAHGMIIAQKELSRCTFLTTRYVGIRPPLNKEAIKKNQTYAVRPLNRSEDLESGYAHMIVIKT